MRQIQAHYILKQLNRELADVQFRLDLVLKNCITACNEALVSKPKERLVALFNSPSTQPVPNPPLPNPLTGLQLAFKWLFTHAGIACGI
jgi:hypothetical protein